MALLAYKRSRQSRNQANANSSFLERERIANNTRKQDISGLDYLPFSMDRLPVSAGGSKELISLETTLKELAGQRIINLSEYSNTDLKMMSGPANLTEYDDNYHNLAKTLFAYADCLAKNGRTDDAAAVLEYAMELCIQFSQIYLLLAQLYRKQHTPEKINSIRDALSKMDEPFGSYVLSKLDDSAEES